MSTNQKYIIFKGEVITLTLGSDNLWRDKDGSIAAFKDDTFTKDPVVRPGIGFFSWRSWWPGYKELTEAAAPHDYQYTSPAYQAFHTRLEADAELADRIRLVSVEAGKPWISDLAHSFKMFARWFGGQAWENPKTR